MNNFKFMWVSIFLISVSSVVSAQDELKLMCNLQVKKMYRSGNQEFFNVKSIVQVNDYGNQLSIIPDGEELSSVATYSLANRTFDNFSNRNKWDLTNTVVREGRKSITNITIDRNTGRIVYSRDWNDGVILSNGEGSCEKIDISVRKF